MTVPLTYNSRAATWLPTFAAPPREYGPTALWLWNDEIGAGIITRQMQMLSEQGVQGVILRAWEGVRPLFGSADWYACVAIAVTEAARLKMTVWLPIEEPGGLASEGMALPLSPLPLGEEQALQAKWLVRAETRLKRAASWARVFTQTAWPEGTPVALLLARPDGSSPVDLTPYLAAPRSAPPLPVEDAEGGWRLIAFFQRLRFSHFAGGYDPLSAPAMEAYLRARIAPYEPLLSTTEGRVVRGFVVGAPDLFCPPPSSGAAERETGAIPWTAQFLEAFRQGKGYDLLPHLPGLWEDVGNAARVRCDYYELISDLLASSFYAPMQRWCAERGLSLAALPALPDTLTGQTLACGNPFAVLRAADIAGSAGQGVLARTLAASILRAERIPEPKAATLIEGGSDWGQTLRELKTQAESGLVSGMNGVALSAFPYAAERLRHEKAPSSLFYQHTFWPLFALFTEPQKRLAFALAQGRRCAEIGVYYPIRAAWQALPPGRLDSLPTLSQEPALAQAEQALAGTLDLLRANQWEVVLLDDQAIEEAQVSEGAIRLGGQVLRTLVLPGAASLPLPAARKLRAFVETGGLLATVGGAPERGIGHGDDAARSLLSTLFAGGSPDLYGNRIQPIGSGVVAQIPEGVGPLRPLLAERVPASVRLTRYDPALRVTHRAGDDFDLFFLACAPGTRRGIVPVRFRANGTPLQLDPETGRSSRLVPYDKGMDRSTLPVDMSSGSALVAFVPEALTGGTSLPERMTLLRAWSIDTGWTVMLAGSLLQTDLRPWNELGQPFYTGRAEYDAPFSIPSRQEMPYNRLFLDLGDVREWAQVWINGVRAGERAWPPFTLDITEFVHPGHNDLHIIVGNTPANALAREERVSGLLGPVLLRAVESQY